ncbi:MAG: VWA domain-containing protein [Verrucomicrobiota bacterium]
MIATVLIFALAELQWRTPLEGLNVFFLFDRSESIPSAQQETARVTAQKFSEKKKRTDLAGGLVFGAEAGIESMPASSLNLPKFEAVVGPERTDIASGIRLGAAAFPENGQKRLVLFSDGNENLGDAQSAALSLKNLGISLDVVPLGAFRANDVSIQKIGLPNKIKKGQVFEVKIFAQSDRAQTATMRLFRNNQFLGEQKIALVAGKNLFTFPQTLDDAGFYSYDVQLDAPGDLLPQNNRASSFVLVRGNPSILLASSDPKSDENLLAALQSSKLEVRGIDVKNFPASLPEIQSYDAIFLSNVAAGDLPTETLKLLEGAVHDFGVGVVCVGGDQTYAAGSYRGTPLETILPVDMELNSKKVLPNGALTIIIDKSGSMAGAKLEMAKEAAMGAVTALSDQDFISVLAFDGATFVVAEMQRARNRKDILERIAGLTAGGGTSMYPPMVRAEEDLRKASASLKHCIILTDGQSTGGDFEGITRKMVENKITVTTVGVGLDFDANFLQMIAQLGRGNFYEAVSYTQLPQIFIKEVAVILKSAIFEEPFKPQLALSSELVRGIGAKEFPPLLGYVCTTPKARAEIPLLTEKGDPLLAHWQYGLGRTVAFTSDAKSKWAADWVGWGKFRQFWSQVAQWSLRRLENADFKTEVSVEKGEGNISVEAVDPQGNFRNFLHLQTVIVSPKGERQTVSLEQTGPGRYEAKFPTLETGAYLMNLMDLKDGELRGSQILGASVNYSPEFSASEPNLNLLQHLAESTGGKVLEPATENPFLHDRIKTFQPRDLWEWLVQCAIILFVFDVAIRRIQLDREQWIKAAQFARRSFLFWKTPPIPVKSDESLAALLQRRDSVRLRKNENPIVVPVLPDADLFRPQQEIKLEPPVEKPMENAKEASAKPEETENTTSKLLKAKRRAQQNRK